MHSGSLRDLASHGYIVFILDHSDETSTYIETAEGEGIHFNNNVGLQDMIIRKKQIEIREKEMMALLDEIEQQDVFFHQTLNFP